MKIFISHSAKTPVSALLSLLKEENATIRGSFELASGQNISESIRTEINSADAVIVVLDSEASNVPFELGIAFALRKPTLLLLRPGDSVPPFAVLLSPKADSEDKLAHLKHLFPRQRYYDSTASHYVRVRRN